MKLREREEKAACTETVSLKDLSPGGPLDAKMLEKPRCEIGNQIAAGPALDEDARKIRAHIVVDEMRARLVDKRKR